MNRIDRLTAILIQLQSKKVVKAAEIAERFGMSLRTVYRDVKALQEAGVPIGAEAGTGYYIVEGYHLPPVMFSQEEAAALLTGEKLMEQFSDRSGQKQFSNAMHKIRAVLRGSEKDFLESLEENIAILKPISPQQEEFPNRFLTEVQQALGGQKVLRLEYFSHHSSETNQREVEPIGVFYSGNRWHLIAYCRLRKAYRDFRIDRIKKLSATSTIFKKLQHPSLQEYLKQQDNNPERPHLIKVRFPHNIARYISEQKYYYGLIAETKEQDYVEMSFLTGHIEYFARWSLMFGNEMQIIESDDLRLQMKQMVAQLHAHYL